MQLNNRKISNKFRVYHRYLGFFLAGIMAIYAFSGVLMIFRNTDFLKQEKVIEQQLPPALDAEALGSALRIRGLKPISSEGDLVVFEQGQYNRSTGMATYTKKELPYLLGAMEKMHKATTDSPLFYLNIFFGASLLFFVISAFWMFMPQTDVFKKGLYFTLAGLILALVVVLF